jgi:hypothetical protein
MEGSHLLEMFNKAGQTQNDQGYSLEGVNNGLNKKLEI